MFKNYQQNQEQLLPQSLNDSISADHTARLINQVIDEMDLSFIESKYSALGQKAYNPKMLFKVLVYGYTIGVRSSRKIADRLNEDIVFMWLGAAPLRISEPLPISVKISWLTSNRRSWKYWDYAVFWE